MIISASTTLVHKPNAKKTNTNSIVFFIFLPFHKSSLAKQGAVSIFIQYTFVHSHLFIEEPVL